QFDHIWLLAIVPVGLWIVTGLILVGVSAWQSRASGSYPAALRDAGAILASGVLFFPISSVGAYMTQELRFAWHKSAYERVVKSIAAQPTVVECGTLEGLD